MQSWVRRLPINTLPTVGGGTYCDCLLLIVLIFGGLSADSLAQQRALRLANGRTSGGGGSRHDGCGVGSGCGRH